MYLPIIKLCCWPQSSADQDFLCHTINEINQSVIEGIHRGGGGGTGGKMLLKLSINVIQAWDSYHTGLITIWLKEWVWHSSIRLLYSIALRTLLLSPSLWSLQAHALLHTINGLYMHHTITCTMISCLHHVLINWYLYIWLIVFCVIPFHLSWFNIQWLNYSILFNTLMFSQ